MRSLQMIQLCLVLLVAGASAWDACYPNPCQNGGKGFQHGTQCYCSCQQQYQGTYCQQYTPPPPQQQQPQWQQPMWQPQAQNPCQPNPCRGGQKSINSGNQCYCQQTTPAPQTFPVQTQSPCQPNPCKNGGQGVNMGNRCYCRCQQQFQGSQCQQFVPQQTLPPQTLPPLTFPPQTFPPQTLPPQNPCLPNPCHNGGNGVPIQNQCYCVCQPQFRGNQCQVPTQPPTLPTPPPTFPTLPPQTLPPQNPCQPNPCGSWSQPIQWNNQCFCQQTTAAPQQNPCQANPCQNQGRCVPQGRQQFQCQCSSQWAGQRCQYWRK